MPWVQRERAAKMSDDDSDLFGLFLITASSVIIVSIVVHSCLGL